MPQKRADRSVGVAIEYHEAGHVVMAWWLDITLRGASIVPDGESQGRATYTPSMRLKPTLPGIAKRNRLDAQICMFTLAGAVAENIHRNTWIEEVAHEYTEAMNIARTLPRKLSLRADFIERNEVRAWHFVQKIAGLTEHILRTHWGAVTQISCALVKHRQLNAEELYTTTRYPEWRLGRGDRRGLR
jgi:hypothetical protein